MREVQPHPKVGFPEGGGEDGDVEGANGSVVENQLVLPKEQFAVSYSRV